MANILLISLVGSICVIIFSVFHRNSLNSIRMNSLPDFTISLLTISLYICLSLKFIFFCKISNIGFTGLSISAALLLNPNVRCNSIFSYLTLVFGRSSVACVANALYAGVLNRLPCQHSLTDIGFIFSSIGLMTYVL